MRNSISSWERELLEAKREKMTKLVRSYILVLSILASFTGCQGDDPNWKETIPVTGEVFVGGKAAEGVMVKFVPTAGMDTAQPTETNAMTDDKGKFSASTYQLGDGAPAGEYRLTFTWPKLNKMSMSFDGDSLKGKYEDPKKSEHTLNVQSGSPVDLGRIDLQGKN